MSDLNGFISYSTPKSEFWNGYSELWNKSEERSAYLLPELMKFYFRKYSGRTATFQFWRNEDLIGVGFFRKYKGVYYFLSDVRSDYNYFVFSKSLSYQEISIFFRQFFNAIRFEQWNLRLNKVPTWARHYSLMKYQATEQCHFVNSVKYGVSPILEASTPQDLNDKLEISKNVLYKSRRLQRNHQIKFEVLKGNEGLPQWIDDFTCMHIKRWEGTTNPSKYTREEERQLLEKCMEIWSSEGVLVRTSLLVDNQRIVANFGLLQNDTFVGQGQSYDLAFYKHSPGKVLFSFLKEWMKDNDIRNLDFGDVDDSYKYEFPVRERILEQVFIANRLSLRFILRAFFQKLIKENRTFNRIIHEQLKPAMFRLQHLF